MSALHYQSIAALIPPASGKFYIAYSGGLDSHVLLHLCATQAVLRPHLVAVYVNHGLQARAWAWAEHCRRQCALLDVDFVSLTVDAKPAGGESPEAAAREARYRALRKLIRPGDVLLFAQHREDQMETVLLQLFRGAGIQGLAAMPPATPFGGGSLARPLLQTAKSAIREYARVHGLNWIEDPSNLSNDFDRNFLRNEVLPLLKQRWPSLDKTVSRSADHCGEASTLLNRRYEARLDHVAGGDHNALALDKLPTVDAAELNWLLRQWLVRQGLKPPSQAVLNAIKQQFIQTGGNANPHLCTQSHVLKKYRQTLYCLPETLFTALPHELIWPANDNKVQLPNHGMLSLTAADSGISQALWRNSRVSLKPRGGAEKLKLPNRAGRHDLKKLFQEAGVPPWERQARPLIYLNDRLAGVAGLWIDEWAWAQIDDGCYRIAWQSPQSV
ncbi:tRNA lysidine(34) synthetase TilS [Methylomonas sp. SURF-2]|uniref:tRNA(Ile)-lysidine synthase n=1 Tax=Methylomonas subterranea TaxID=2952225 RepID=A0ABT1TH73_9GAMM|nr:tRNA lysidine(34) synthetase TilS [Methylomonas sp. SURF-2]MCQ8104798.1 tRNA lysidine(34) synthetase TilS [Methylomonas sp. SURF-2]